MFHAPSLLRLSPVSVAAEGILKWGVGVNLGESGGMLPREILKLRVSEMARNASFLLK